MIRDVHEVVRQNPIGENEPYKVTPLHDSRERTVTVVQVRTSMPLHYHATHDETATIVEGSGTFRMDTQDVKVQTGSVLFIPRGTRHAYTHEGHGVTIAVVVTTPRLASTDRVFVPTQ